MRPVAESLISELETYGTQESSVGVAITAALLEVASAIDRLTDSIDEQKKKEDTPGVSSYILNGTTVITTHDAGSHDWYKDGRHGTRKCVGMKARWGEVGNVIGSHDSHGLYYDVKHKNGEVLPYEASEVVVLSKIQIGGKK